MNKTLLIIGCTSLIVGMIWSLRYHLDGGEFQAGCCFGEGLIVFVGCVVAGAIKGETK